MVGASRLEAWMRQQLYGIGLPERSCSRCLGMRVVGVAFSPDGIRFATSSTDSTAKIWDVKTGKLLFTLTGHTAAVTDIEYSPDGLKIATGILDATAKIWDAATGAELP